LKKAIDGELTLYHNMLTFDAPNKLYKEFLEDTNIELNGRTCL